MNNTINQTAVNPETITLPLEKWMEMLNARATTVAAESNDPFQRFVGKTVFIRGAIFAFFGTMLESFPNEIVCKEVCWIPDAGELDQLLAVKKGTHVSTVSGVKLQYYPPEKEVLFVKAVLSDISIFDGDYKQKLQNKK